MKTTSQIWTNVGKVRVDIIRKGFIIYHLPPAFVNKPDCIAFLSRGQQGVDFFPKFLCSHIIII